MLKNILSEAEFRVIPENVVSKLDRVLSENSENYVTTKALYETYKHNQEEELNRLQGLLQQERSKNESIGLEYNRKSSEFEELENKLRTLEKQNLQLKTDIVWHENEARTFRLQRDEAVDEKSSLQVMLSRRTSELEQLKIDYDGQSEKLKQTMQAKIEALTKLDEIQSLQIELDFKEKRLNKERELMTEQINVLTNDLAKQNNELVIIKREHTAQLIDYQNRIQVKDEELRTLQENENNFKKQLHELTDKISELNARLAGQSEVEKQLQQKYVVEIDSRTKLADTYKEMSEQSNRKSEELAKTAKELQNLLSEASAQYEDLERRFTINETTYEEHLKQKNETIAALKKELVDANHLIDTLKRDHLTETLENLSPHAAAAANLLKKGMTLTQIYSEYASVSEQLMIKTHDNEQLKHMFKSFVEELEGKAHLLKKRNDDYAEAMETIEKISRNYDQLEMSFNVAKEKYDDAERNIARMTREKEMFQKTVSDLSRQVCYLLKQIEEARGGHIGTSMALGDDGNYSNCVNSADIISKKLVTFRDIEELQETNQKLLSVVRNLSEDFEKAEAKLKECNKEELEENIKRLENMLSEREEATERQDKIIQMLKSQIKMLQMMGPAEVIDGSAKRMLTCDINAVLHIKNVRDIDIQTDSVEIESIVCSDLRKELEAVKTKLADVKNEFETSTNEHVKNERMMLESLEKSERNYQTLSQDYKKIIAQAEVSEEKCKSLTLSMNSLKTEIAALENRGRLYSQTIGKHEQTITMLRDEAMKAMSSLSRVEVLYENTKRECEYLRNNEARIVAERDILKQDQIGHASLLLNLESIKASLDRSEAEWKLKMDDKLDSSMKECSALRRRLQDEQDRYTERLSQLEQTVETMKSRLEEERKSSSELINVTNSLKLDIEERNRCIEELKEKLRNASSKSVTELELQIKSLQSKYQSTLRDLDYQKELLNAAKKNTEEFKTFSDDIEKKWTVERENYLKQQREMETRIAKLSSELAGLRGRNEMLQKRVNELTGLNDASMVNLSDELQQERHKYASMVEEFATMKHQLAVAQNELKVATEDKLAAEKKYTEEMLQRTSDIKTLQSKVDNIMELENKVVMLTAEKDAALKKAEAISATWREEENQLRQELNLQSEKMKAVVQQNELLLNQIEELSVKITVSQRRDSIDKDQSISSVSSETDNNLDNLLQVINYLRREKNLANTQLEVLSTENRRLKSEVELFKHQLTESHLQLKAEHDKSDMSTTTAAKHAELVSKVQTLNALTDSNRVLREERDRYCAELAQLEERIANIESSTVTPLREETKRLQLQVETLQTEILGINKECAMWRNRVTGMTEKMNKTNSDELKDLKKTLNKEREEYNKTLDVLRAVKQEKSKLEEQMKKLQGPTGRITQLEKEKSDLMKELTVEKGKIQKLSQEFDELQKTTEIEMNKHKNSNVQIKSIARKYKTQCQELTEKNTALMEQMKELEAQILKTSASAAVDVMPSLVVDISVEEQNRLRQEGRQEMETEVNERLRLLNDRVTTNQNTIEQLEAENKTLKETVAEKDVRNTDIMQQAKTRINNLTKFSKKQVKDNETKQKQIDEYSARVNVMESRISLMEKENLELRNERDRSAREVEVLTQRLNSIQRLHTQQSVKSNVNISQEKSNTEPPTANIKPMAGPSSSVTKPQQNQQSVAVTPWRSANETPLASIRPMSMQTRTAAVLPTSQTSCSASQSTVMVPPQQQLVDTSSNAPSIVEAFSSSPSSSSHSDYNMPSTSSSVSHPPLRQVVVTPTQQTSHSAESTQDVEAECVIQELTSQPSHSNQQQSSQSQNQSTPLSTPFVTTPAVSQSQMPTVALVLPRIDLQNVSAAGPSLLSNAPEPSVVASSQTNVLPLVSASNQTDSSSANKRTETYYQQDNEDSNLGQVSASNQHGQQQAVVASSIETAPEQSIVIASSQHSYDKSMSEPSVASSNANSSNTVTTTQARLKRSREMEGESSKGPSNTETGSMTPQVKRSRRMEQTHTDLFRNDIDDNNSTDTLLKYRGLDVEYQVPTSSQRDQEFDNLVIDSEAEDEPEEDEQTMPDDGIIDENDDGPEYVEDEEEVENEEVYENEDYDREEQDTTMTSYNIIEGPDIDEEGVQVQDQDNEVEIDEESNEVPNQSNRSDSTALMVGRRNLEQQSSEATSSGNNLRAQSASISSNQSLISLQLSRRPSTILPLSRQQSQQLLLSQGFEDNPGDDSIVPSTPTLCVPHRTDGFGEAVSSPQVPSTGRFTFNDNNPPTSRAGVAQMISEGMDDTRMDLSQLEENSGTGRSVPTTPLQSSPQDIGSVEVGHSSEDGQQMSEELTTSNSNQQQQPSEDILMEPETFRSDTADNDLKVTNESESLMDEPTDPGRNENADVTSDGGQVDPSVAGTSQGSGEDIEEGREAEAVTKTSESRPSPQPIPTTNQTARRGNGGNRAGRSRGMRTGQWGSSPRNQSLNQENYFFQENDIQEHRRGSFRDRGRKQNRWFNSNRRYG